MNNKKSFTQLVTRTSNMFCSTCDYINCPRNTNNKVIYTIKIYSVTRTSNILHVITLIIQGIQTIKSFTHNSVTRTLRSRLYLIKIGPDFTSAIHCQLEVGFLRVFGFTFTSLWTLGLRQQWLRKRRWFMLVTMGTYHIKFSRGKFFVNCPNSAISRVNFMGGQLGPVQYMYICKFSWPCSDS